MEYLNNSILTLLNQIHLIMQTCKVLRKMLIQVRFLTVLCSVADLLNDFDPSDRDYVSVQQCVDMCENSKEYTTLVIILCCVRPSVNKRAMQTFGISPCPVLWGTGINFVRQSLENLTLFEMCPTFIQFYAIRKKNLTKLTLIILAK